MIERKQAESMKTMKTVVFEATESVVRRYASDHLSHPRIRSAGRLTAVQSESLEEIDATAIREIAEAYNLPLVAVHERPPFPAPERPQSRSQSRSQSGPPRQHARRARAPLVLPPGKSNGRRG